MNRFVNVLCVVILTFLSAPVAAEDAKTEQALSKGTFFIKCSTAEGSDTPDQKTSVCDLILYFSDSKFLMEAEAALLEIGITRDQYEFEDPTATTGTERIWQLKLENLALLTAYVLNCQLSQYGFERLIPSAAETLSFYQEEESGKRGNPSPPKQ